jgi:uncharacterized protein (DUF58 family)
MRPGVGLIVGLVMIAAIGVAVLSGWAPMALLVSSIVLLSLLALLDAIELKRAPSPQVERQPLGVLPLGVRREVRLEFRGMRGGMRTLVFKDRVPPTWPSENQPQRVRLDTDRNVAVSYALTPIERGEFNIAGVDVDLDSRLRFWRQIRFIATLDQLRVFPNFAPLAKLALTGLDLASRSLGAHLKRRRGEGTDFHQLRDYRAGDMLRQIDWKATQRVRRLISRDYTDERNQRVMLVLDRGRRMRTLDGPLSHFDHALNASLVLSYIALRQGDSVGLLSAGDPLRYLSPVSGPGGLDALMNAVFDLQPQLAVTDYPETAQLLLTHQPRRSLVVLLTNVRDEDIDDLLRAVNLLKRRHLVCVASLREALLEEIYREPVAAFEDALTVAATAQYLTHRALAHAKLRASGAQVLDVSCAELAPTLIEHYLALKRAGAL